MRLHALLIIISVAAIMQPYAASIRAQSYTKSQANLTISNVTEYIAMVNESSYLIFSPNLAQAYSYIGKAQNALNDSPDLAVRYAQLANISAGSAYDAIGQYKNYSLLAMLVFTGVMALLLYVYAIGKKRKGSIGRANG